MNWLRLVAVGLLVAAVLGGCGDRPDIRVEHRTIDAAPDPLADAGPPPGAYERTWTSTVRTESGQPTYHVVGGQVVVVSKDAIDAYDARTGKPSWHYREPGRQIEGFAATGAVVVAEFRKDSDRVTDEHMLALDAGTGDLLWENAEEWDLTYDGDASYSLPQEQADAADGIVQIATDDDERLGIQARTGDEVWDLSEADFGSGECTAPERIDRDVPATTDVLPVQLLCDEQDYGSDGLATLLFVVEANSGEVLWGRRIDSGENGSVEVQVRGGVTRLEPAATEQPPELVGPDGRTLFTRKAGRCGSACELSVNEGRALLRYEEATGTHYEGGDERTRDMLAAIDLRTGRTARLPVPGLPGMEYVAAGGKLYGLSAYHGADGPVIEQLFVPAGLLTVDVLDHRIEQTPMPYPSSMVFPTGAGMTYEQLVAVGGSRLFTVTRSNDPGSEPDHVELTAYASKDTVEPTELRGVAPDEWPDPCRLLAKLPVDDDERQPVEPGGKARLGDVTLDGVECTRDLTTVRIGWVARTEREAAALLPAGRPSAVGADEEAGSISAPTYYRVGRVILSVETYQLEADAVVRKVIENLRAL